MKLEERLLVRPEGKEEEEEEEEGGLTGRTWAELKKLGRVALPAMLARSSQFGMFVVTQGFIGHIGEVQLAAYALIQLIAVRFSNGILLGMSSATETLCGQAFGAKQYHMMGIYLQRSCLINLTTATLILPVFIFASNIFKFLGENTDISNKAGQISIWFIAILYFFAFGLPLQKYLQAQLKNAIVGWLSTVAFLVHVLFSWIFVSKLGWGIPGAMGAMIIASWGIVIGDFVYVLGGWCSKTWTGFSLAAFHDLLPVVKLSISSGVMLCLELWYYAVLVLLAGYMKNAAIQISAFSICLNIVAWEYMLCFGILAATGVRVSNELGSGNAKGTKFAVIVALCVSLCMGSFFWIICLLFSTRIAYLFTNNEQVIESVSSLSTLLAFSVLFNSAQTVFSGAAVGAGRQKIVAFINIGCYYFIGVPIGLLLGYVADLKVEGIWIGMLLGVVMQTLVLGYITWKTDWDEQVNRAMERLNRWLLPSNEYDDNSNHANLS